MAKQLSQVSFPTRRAYPHLKDAEEPYVAVVTLELDVKGAVSCDRHNCPLVRAIRRDPEVRDALVTDYRVYIDFHDGELLRYVIDNLPTNAFDNTSFFPPGIYILMPPTPSARLGKSRGSPIGGAQAKRTKRSLR